MIALPLVLIVAAGILFAWMLHTATVYALPFLAGWGAATLAYNSGAGLEGAAIVGIAAAMGTFASLRLILEQMPDGPIRLVVALAPVLPSLVLGYNIALDVLEGVVPSDMWRHAISLSYAAFGGWLAFLRLTEIKD